MGAGWYEFIGGVVLGNYICWIGIDYVYDWLDSLVRR